MSKRKRQRNRGRRQELTSGRPAQKAPLRESAGPQPTAPAKPAETQVQAPVSMQKPTPRSTAKSSIAEAYSYVGRDIRWLAGTSVVLFLFVGLARFVI